jgi:hypothetical protein
MSGSGYSETIDGEMAVQSGKICGIKFSSAGPTDRTEISQKPAHGKAMVGSVQTIIYMAQPGYVGKDLFVYVRHGRNPQNNPAVRTMRISVTVTP